MDVLNGISDQCVLVIGDVMLDQFVYGQVDRLSPETNAPILWEKQQKQMPGGAANVAVNVAALGGRCRLIGLTGDDAAASMLSNRLSDWPNIHTDLVIEPSWQTITKTRFINKNTGAHLLRLDQERADALPDTVSTELAERALRALHQTDVVVLSDYCKGVLSPEMIRRVIDAAVSLQIPVIVDPKKKDFSLYSGATVIAPNLDELSIAVGRVVPQDDIEVEQAASDILRGSSAAAICVKRSEAGLQIVRAAGSSTKFVATTRSVVDVAGAGDTVVACLAISMACGADLQTAASLANAAAGIVVAKEGVAPASYAELEATLTQTRIGSEVFSTQDLDPILDLVQRWKADDLTVGLTNGCFDLLHAGHLSSLDESRRQVDRLVVAINSDSSVKRLKGSLRPIQDERTRAIIVAALRVVDAVIIFEDDTPLKIITQLCPDVIFKGGDYKVEDVVGHGLVTSYGGRVVITDHKSGISTTETIRRALKTHRESSPSVMRPNVHEGSLFEYNAINPALPSLQSIDGLRKDVTELYTWLKEIAWPYWLEQGLARTSDGVAFGFKEHLDDNGRSCPADQQRLLVVARQTYVFSEALAAGIEGAKEAVVLGLKLMRSHARNGHTGLYNSFFSPQSDVQDLHNQSKDLYDHSFVLFALASVMKVLPSEEIRDIALSLDTCMQKEFRHPLFGLYDTLPPTQLRRQNPHMHLFEAYLAAFEAFRSDVYISRADDLISLFLEHLWDPMTGGVPERLDDTLHAELVDGRYLIEPGHLAEWVRLIHWYKNINVSLGRPLGWKEDLAIKGMIRFYETHGCHSVTKALVDDVWSDGTHHCESQRLWPQTERLQAELLRHDVNKMNVAEAVQAVSAYIHAAPAGLWAESRSPDESFFTDSCKASSLYHLTFAIATARRVLFPNEFPGEDTRIQVNHSECPIPEAGRQHSEPGCSISPTTRHDSPIFTPVKDIDELITDGETMPARDALETHTKPMVVVTGGAGFIGSNIVATLNEWGDYDVTICDYLGVENKWLNLRKRTIRDLIPPNELMAWLDTQNDVYAVIHMGANSSTQARDGDEVIESNFRTSLRILDWCTKRRVKLIYASSAATYGNGDQGFDDDMSLSYLKTLRPLNLYGWSKHLFDQEVARRQESNAALPPVCIGLKFFNVFGPNEYHKGSMSSLVTKYFPSIRAGKSVDLFRSYKAEYADGGQLRDFVYVHDVSDAVLWLLNNASPGAGLYNIGSARASSFLELVTASFDALGLTPQINFIDMPPDLRASYQYFTKAEDARLRSIGYQRPWSTVQDAVTHFVKNYLATEDPYR